MIRNDTKWCFEWLDMLYMIGFPWRAHGAHIVFTWICGTVKLKTYAKEAFTCRCSRRLANANYLGYSASFISLMFRFHNMLRIESLKYNKWLHIIYIYIYIICVNNIYIYITYNNETWEGGTKASIPSTPIFSLGIFSPTDFPTYTFHTPTFSPQAF